MKLVCRDFAIGFTVAAVALVGLTLIIRVLVGMDLSRATILIILVSGAYWAGVRHGRRTGAPAESGFAWRVTIVLLPIGLALSAAVAGAIWLLMPANMGRAFMISLQEIDPQWFALAGVLAFVIHLLFIRFFFGKGAKAAVKDLERERRRESLR